MQPKRLFGLFACLAAFAIAPMAIAHHAPGNNGDSVIADDALLTGAVSGLADTQASAQVVPVTGQQFRRALRVVIGKPAADSNATQMTIPIATPVHKGDVLLASCGVRGRTADGKGLAQVILLFEKRVAPWTKSLTESASADANADTWRRVSVPFVAAESYQPGEAMVSVRFAVQPQTVEVGGLSVVNFGTSKSLDDLLALAATASPLVGAHVTVHRDQTRQTMVGFGGDFCQARYGATEAMDAVGRYNLEHLHVAHARIGIPLNWWEPEKGIYKEEGQPRAALLAMQEMKRRAIPFVGSVWEGPEWMLPGARERAGKKLPPTSYADCAESIAQFLVTARDKYHAAPDYVSFNEPDYGVNFHFTPAEMDAFIRVAGPRFRGLRLQTKFMIGDTTGGIPFPDYARPLLEDAAIAPYLGPLAFHCWDVLSAPDAKYEEIAALGRQYHKPVWCTEAGHDAGLWEKPNPFASWENGLRTAIAYEKTLRLSGAVLLDYWTYQDNFPLADQAGATAYPVLRVIQQFEQTFPAGYRVTLCSSSTSDLMALAAQGPGLDKVSLMLIAPRGGGMVTIDGLPPNQPLMVSRSDAASQDRDDATTRPADAGGRTQLMVGPRSVVSVFTAPRWFGDFH